jgi:RimJ/RimL family protein N-acetyltransferase
MALDTICVDDHITLTDLQDSDCEPLVKYLNDERIYEHTLRIPHPYTEANARLFLDFAGRATLDHGRPVLLAIREAREELIGGFGFEGWQPEQPHRAEIGYWVARPFWGQGIGSAVVKRMCQYGFEQFDLSRITAYVFDTNIASARVLEKNSFVLEGILRKYHLKDGKFIDARVYALLR